MHIPIFQVFVSRRWLQCRGVALLELMLATAIMGTALITLGVAVGRCVRGLSSADYIQAAMDLAEYHFAEWRALNAGGDEIKLGLEEGEKTIHNRKFKWRQETEGTSDPKIFKITLSIQWIEGGQERQRSFITLVPKTPLKIPK